ncbi:MAG TPA: hypothetical protein VFE14_09810, partial [Micromonosporaceae bacterium]|nr:hypothetical protein [Micromonosporaceae bacterium]
MVRRPRAARIIARWAGGTAEALAVAAVAVHLTIVALTTPSQPGEAFGIARVVAAVRPDVGPFPGGWPGRVFGAVVAGWVSLSGALPRHATALAAVREGVLVASLATVACAWLLARRFRLAGPTRVAAVLVIGALPMGTGLLTAVRPGAVAAAAVAAVTVSVAGERVGPTARVFAVVGLLGAVALVPAALPALFAVLAVLLGQDDLGTQLAAPIRRGLAAVAGGLAVAVL